MARHLGLVARVRKQERRARLRVKRPGPFVFAIFDDEDPGPIMGLKANGQECARAYGEDDFGAFVERAAATCGQSMFFTAVYAPEPRPEAVAVPSAGREPGPVSPFAVGQPGIGRYWTADERRRMVFGPDV